jgi:hypothetical protein
MIVFGKIVQFVIFHVMTQIIEFGAIVSSKLFGTFAQVRIISILISGLASGAFLVAVSLWPAVSLLLLDLSGGMPCT